MFVLEQSSWKLVHLDAKVYILPISRAQEIDTPLTFDTPDQLMQIGVYDFGFHDTINSLQLQLSRVIQVCMSCVLMSNMVFQVLSHYPYFGFFAGRLCVSRKCAKALDVFGQY